MVSISYTSESGELWVVMNEAQAGWMRVGDGRNGDPAACDGSTCQVTYEQIAALCGDDVSTWGSTMQCESSTAWEVYSVAVGQAVDAAAPAAAAEAPEAETEAETTAAELTAAEVATEAAE